MPAILDILPQLLFVANIAAITLSVTSINAFYELSSKKYQTRNGEYLHKKYQPGTEFEFHFEPHTITWIGSTLFCISEITLIIGLFVNIFAENSVVVFSTLNIVSLFFFSAGVVVLFGTYIYLGVRGNKDLSKKCPEIENIWDAITAAP